MSKVAIVSSATSQFVRNSDRPITDLAVAPCAKILLSNPLIRDKIDAVLVSTCSSEQYLGPIISEMLGLRPKIAQRIDNLCNSGSNSVVTGYSLIASGLCDMVLVVGAEKQDSPGNKLTSDYTRGSFSLPVHWAALFANAYMRRYSIKEEQLASISVRNRQNALKNPTALFRKPITVQNVMESKKIVSPLKLLDCSATCDGSAAVVLVSEDLAREFENPVWIKGIGQQSNSASFVNATTDLTTIESAVVASRRAFAMADLTPSEIDIAEVHDAFSILELLAIEDLGFSEKGKGMALFDEPKLTINPRGGIIGCGHPVGATGVAQTAEVFEQLSGSAGSRQVKACKTGLVHNLSAAGSSATVLILEGN